MGEWRVEVESQEDSGIPHGRTVVVCMGVVRGRLGGWVSTGGGQTTDGGVGGMGGWCQEWS